MDVKAVMLSRLQVLHAFILVSIIALLVETPEPLETIPVSSLSGDAARVSVSLAHWDHFDTDSWFPNTSIILLNWSRFHNVKNITTTLCEHMSQEAKHGITVWNNNPLPLAFSDFVNTTCSKENLNIINSPNNLYFEARYMACAESTTLYCFIQDDDYLVLPETIQALTMRMSEKLSSKAIHLQPTDEMLSSQLRTIIVNPRFHTAFAWLGYGAIIRRSSAVEFLDLIDKLRLSDEQHKMADNYFTILSNDIPERWFDPGIPLGGGQPFTVGVEGEERNNRHIIEATRLLERIIPPSLDNQPLPYVQFSLERRMDNISRAPCQGSVCIFETSIRLLPENLDVEPVSAVTEILAVEKKRLQQLGELRKTHYLQFPPSNAVDSQYETAFRSAEGAAIGEWILLDMLRPISSSQTKLVLVVGLETEAILLSAIFEYSRDGDTWYLNDSEPRFENVKSDFGIPAKLCRINFEGYNRSFRVRSSKDFQQEWVIYEIHVDSNPEESGPANERLT